MVKFFAGVILSTILALWLEFFYKFGATYDPVNFVGAIGFYFFYLCILHAVFCALGRARLRGLAHVAIGGGAGLLVEWLLVGNSPWQNPAALQWGQFVFHAGYPVLGYLVVRVPDNKRLRFSLLIYLLLATVVTCAGFLSEDKNIRFLWFVFLPLFTYCGLLYYICRFAALRFNNVFKRKGA